jgi:hypothetical protein
MNAIFMSTEVAKMVSQQMHPFYSIGPKVMFGYLLEQLENLRHVNRYKTWVSGMNALFWCTEVAKMVSHQMHVFYSIGPKVMFGCLLEHLENICDVQRWKTRVSRLNAIFWCSEVAKNSFAPNASTLLHWTENDVWLSFRTFRQPLACKKMQNLYIGHECNILVYRSCKNGYAPNGSILIHWTENDVWLSFRAVRNIWYVKRCKTCVSGMNAIFWCTEVAEMVS